MGPVVVAPISPATEDLAQNTATGPNGWNGEGKGLQIGPTTCWRTVSHRPVAGQDDSKQQVDHGCRECRSGARCLSPKQTPRGWWRPLEFKDILDYPYLSFPPSISGIGKGIRTTDILLGVVGGARAPAGSALCGRSRPSAEVDLAGERQLGMQNLKVVHACGTPCGASALTRSRQCPL